MNGDDLKIFNAVNKAREEVHKVDKRLTAIETKQEERHAENKEALKVLFKKTQTLDDMINEMPCKTNVEKLKNLEKANVRLERILFGVVICGIILGIWIKLVLAG